MRKQVVKKISMIAAAVSLAFGTGICAAADGSAPQIKVATVNVQQVLQQSPRVAELSKKLETQFKVRQQKIADMQKSLQTEQDKFSKESLTMAPKSKDLIQKKMTAERADLVKLVVAYQQDLNKEQGKVMQNIMGDLNGIVTSIAKNQSYALVLDSQAVVFAGDGNDITKDVAKEFNNKS